MAKDINIGPWSSNPDELTDVAGVLYLSANDGDQWLGVETHGREPWRSDGSWAGTKMVKDPPAPQAQAPSN